MSNVLIRLFGTGARETRVCLPAHEIKEAWDFDYFFDRDRREKLSLRDFNILENMNLSDIRSAQKKLVRDLTTRNTISLSLLFFFQFLVRGPILYVFFLHGLLSSGGK